MMWILSVTMLALAVAGASLVANGASLGEVLYRLTPDTLLMVQVGVQRYMAEWIWEDVAMPLLVQPAWLIPSVLALVFAALGLRPYVMRRGNMVRH